LEIAAAVEITGVSPEHGSFLAKPELDRVLWEAHRRAENAPNPQMRRIYLAKLAELREAADVVLAAAKEKDPPIVAPPIDI
jgi:hypothetical protein